MSPKEFLIVFVFMVCGGLVYVSLTTPRGPEIRAHELDLPAVSH